MKLKSILSCLAAVFLTSSATFAATLADWTFESLTLSTTYTNNPPNGWCTNVAAEVGSGTAIGFHNTAAASYSTPAGNGSSKSLSANNWTVNDFYQFAVSGAGASSFVVTFQVNGSGTGPRDFNFQYSTDGSIFTTFTNYQIPSGISWSSGTANTNSDFSYDLSSVTALNGAGTVYFRLTDADTTSVTGGAVGTGGTSRVDNFIVTAFTGTPPTISGVSPSTLTTNAGNNVSFTVTLSGGDTPLTYFWYKGAVSPANLISGATNATLTLSNVLAADAANYQVVVSNAISTATSDVIPLTVIDPAINVQPVSQQGLTGGAVQFHVSAAGTGTLGYQWYFCADPGDNTQITGQVGNGTLGSGAVVSGATGSTLMVSNLTYADPTNFVVVVTGDNGSVTSSVASFTVASSQVPLAFWNFNGALNNTNPAPYQGIGTAFATNCQPFAQNVGTAVDGNDYESLGGVNYSWGTQNYPASSTSNKQAGVQFNVSTVNAKDITLSFDVRGTTTASKYFRLQFTTNGTDFIDYPSSDFIPGGDASTYKSRNYSLVGFPNVANNPHFGVRIVTEFENTALYGTTNDANYVGVTNAYAPGGTLSYDLVTFNANAITGGTYAPPTIGAIANITIPDNVPHDITLTVSGDTTGATAQSFNQNVLAANVSGNTLTLSPNGVDGVAPVLVTVMNANGDSAATWFNVTTVPANQPPTITGLADTNMLENTTLTIPFTLGDDYTDMSAATPTVTSGNSTLAPVDGTHVALGGSGTNRTLIITPVTNEFGVAPIKVSVSDGLLTTTQTVILEVRQNTNVVLVDHFDYDGSGALITQSGGFWATHSGTAGQLQVGSGLITVDGVHNKEDVNAPLIDGPYMTNSGTVLYSSFVINYTTLPNATGAYFAHFKDNTSSGFLCRIFASTTNATTPGSYRIGIGNSSGSTSTTAQIEQDLLTNVNYTVVSRLVLSNGISTVWVNPTGESSPGATDTTAVANLVNIYAYAFREDAAEQGILTVSNLVVGTSFAAVTGIVPSAQLNIQLTNHQAVLSWGDSSFSLQSSTNVAGPYSTIGAAHSPSYTDPLTNSARFYRLIH